MPNGYDDCWTSPDGDADFDDITATVDKLKNLPGAAMKSRAVTVRLPAPCKNRAGYSDSLVMERSRRRGCAVSTGALTACCPTAGTRSHSRY